jgi:hypothetical protein
VQEATHETLFAVGVLACGLSKHRTGLRQGRARRQLVEQAEAKANIFALPSFEINADIRISDGDKDLDGSYRLLWNGPGQWREEISFPAYSEVQVGAKGVVFLKRSTDVTPMRIDQLRSALGYGSGTPHPRSLVHFSARCG